jgi:pimeloyl-ACP methyl ester carboxylesterase
VPSIRSDGVEIAYRDEGEGDPVLLIHGFASNATVNWADPGWLRHLSKAGFRAIAIDNRGHGSSQKLYRADDYGARLMAEDARRLLDHLAIPRADVMGYSMGARITVLLALIHPAQVRSAILGGLGINIVRPMAGTEAIAAALEAASVEQVHDPVARTFRAFADQTGSDRLALAACIRAARDPVPPEALARIACPVLVAVGTDDAVAGSARELAALIPGARALDITGRDHMKAVGDRVYKEGVLAFLRGRP